MVHQAVIMAEKAAAHQPQLSLQQQRDNQKAKLKRKKFSQRTDLEETLGTSTTGVDDPLGDPLAVKLSDLLYELVVFQQDRACREEQ